MKKILVVGIIVLFLLVGIYPTLAIDTIKEPIIPLNNGNTLYVGGSGPGNYTKIQDAIDNASDGDTVYVYEGTYYEKVLVYKSINLIGENNDTTIIDGGGSGNVINVIADWVNVSGFTIQNTGDDWGTGIYINSNYNSITGNTISSNNENGIRLYQSSNNNIIGNNIISNNKPGIYLSGYYKPSKNNIIRGNNISLNMEGIRLYSNGNIITGNTISSNNGSGIFISNYDYHGYNNTITGNKIISNNGYGIYLDSSSNTITNNNIISNNDNGLKIVSKDNNITGNNISSNNRNGILLWMSSNTIAENNIISNNGNGIEIEHYQDNNLIYHNNLIDNIDNAYDEGNNIWDDGQYGNYWSDYEERYPDAKKLPFKGIWDTPYEIPGGDNKDNCPLINQWPNSKSRTLHRNTASYNFYWLRFLERFPLLERLLYLL